MASKRNFITDMKMRSMCQSMCLYILLISIIVIIGSSAKDKDQNSNFDSRNRNYEQGITKNTNRNLSEHRTAQMPSQHHLRHPHNHAYRHYSRNDENYNNYHKHRSHHQSNDNAFSSSRLPANQRQSNAPKKYTSYNDDDDSDAAATSGRLNHQSELQRNHHLKHQKPFPYRITTQGPPKNRQHYRSGQNNDAFNRNTHKNSTAMNASVKYRKGVAPTLKNNRMSASDNRSFNRKSNDAYRKTIKETPITTTTTTTTTLAPEQNKYHNENNDEDDADDEDDDDFDPDYNFFDEYTPQNSPNVRRDPKSLSSNSYDQRYTKSNQLINENYQKDDPIRNKATRSTNNNGVAVNTSKSSRLSNNDNFNSNVNNDQSTIETSKMFSDDVKTNATMRNTSIRVSVMGFSLSLFIFIPLNSRLCMCRLKKENNNNNEKTKTGKTTQNYQMYRTKKENMYETALMNYELCF